jgi:hypothetical protein
LVWANVLQGIVIIGVMSANRLFIEGAMSQNGERRAAEKKQGKKSAVRFTGRPIRNKLSEKIRPQGGR